MYYFIYQPMYYFMYQPMYYFMYQPMYYCMYQPMYNFMYQPMYYIMYQPRYYCMYYRCTIAWCNVSCTSRCTIAFTIDVLLHVLLMCYCMYYWCTISCISRCTSACTSRCTISCTSRCTINVLLHVPADVLLSYYLHVPADTCAVQTRQCTLSPGRKTVSSYTLSSLLSLSCIALSVCMWKYNLVFCSLSSQQTSPINVQFHHSRQTFTDIARCYSPTSRLHRICTLIMQPPVLVSAALAGAMDTGIWRMLGVWASAWGWAQLHMGGFCFRFLLFSSFDSPKNSTFRQILKVFIVLCFFQCMRCLCFPFP
jgi:hypothetical protein